MSKKSVSFCEKRKRLPLCATKNWGGENDEINPVLVLPVFGDALVATIQRRGHGCDWKLGFEPDLDKVDGLRLFQPHMRDCSAVGFGRLRGYDLNRSYFRWLW